MGNEFVLLLKIGNMKEAKVIQSMLEESGIYSMLESDNPASSIMNIYSGLNAIENITIQVTKNDYHKAIKIIRNTKYAELLKN
ncbi:putative signal transducing protein [Bacteroidota bacterium]